MSWILTQSGARVDLASPSRMMITAEDIAHGLANLCRFNGHTREFYSVAQHSVLASTLVPKEHRLATLLHDATEAYVGDMVRPMKELLPDFARLEQGLWRTIAERFGVAQELPESVHTADCIMLATERRDLMPAHDEPWSVLEGIEPADQTIHPWAPDVARRLFLEQLEALQSEGSREPNYWHRLYAVKPLRVFRARWDSPTHNMSGTVVAADRESIAAAIAKHAGEPVTVLEAHEIDITTPGTPGGSGWRKGFFS